jgi:hypothetical protein
MKPQTSESTVISTTSLPDARKYRGYRIFRSNRIWSSIGKALLDWIYLTLQSGLTPHLDEIELTPIDKRKLAKYAEKYPGTVRKALMTSLAFEHFAA